MFSGDAPIFQQLAAKIADDIVSGAYPEETAVPSATDFAVFYQMNPATASKGVNLLVDLGALYKKRGVGMFVAAGARELVRARRREEFRTQYLQPLLREAGVLEIETPDLHRMIDEVVRADARTADARATGTRITDSRAADARATDAPTADQRTEDAS